MGWDDTRQREEQSMNPINHTWELELLARIIPKWTQR